MTPPAGAAARAHRHATSSADRAARGPRGRTAAATGAHAGVAAPARRLRPVHAPARPRRVSGPGARPASARQPARRSVFDSPFLDRLVQGRAWIWVIGVGLIGIVFMQVSLLKMNSGIGRAVETSTTLERKNALLEASIAKLSSGERIQGAAARMGLVSPPAGSTRFLRVRPGFDGQRAVDTMRPPKPVATATPGALVAAPAAGTTTAPATAGAGTTTATATAPATATTTEAAPATGAATGTTGTTGTAAPATGGAAVPAGGGATATGAGTQSPAASTGAAAPPSDTAGAAVAP